MKSKIQHRDFSAEAKFTASKSSGPGGQNVNKVNTKVELRLNIKNSLLLSEEEKTLVLKKWANRINKEGELLVISQSERSQIGNKEKAIQRLNQLLCDALTVAKERIPSKIPKAAKRKRLKNKKLKSEIKKLRKPLEL